MSSRQPGGPGHRHKGPPASFNSRFPGWRCCGDSWAWDCGLHCARHLHSHTSLTQGTRSGCGDLTGRCNTLQARHGRCRKVRPPCSKTTVLLPELDLGRARSVHHSQASRPHRSGPEVLHSVLQVPVLALPTACLEGLRRPATAVGCPGRSMGTDEHGGWVKGRNARWCQARPGNNRRARGSVWEPRGCQ